MLCYGSMTTEDLTKRLRVVQGLLRERQFEFALALVVQLGSALEKLPTGHRRVVPMSVRTQIDSLRAEAEAAIRAAA